MVSALTTKTRTGNLGGDSDGYIDSGGGIMTDVYIPTHQIVYITYMQFLVSLLTSIKL